jgi:tetratricopeptide (TPR) repeat protein
MLRRVMGARWIGVVLLASSAGWPAIVAAAQGVEPTGEAAIAWRLDTIARAQLGPDRPNAAFRQSAALLDAAQRLVPQEPRFPRLRMLALERIGDTDGAIQALSDYRKLEGGDTVAQVHLIDLYASKLETLDAKVKYLTDLVNNPKVQLPPEVRSHLAAEAATLLAEKSPEQAAAMATQAVKLYPLPSATRLYYRYVGRNKPLAERFSALLAVIKANPNQPAYLSEMANLLAENGLAEQSLLWYDEAVYTILASHAPPPPWYHNLLVDYAAQRAIAGRIALADQLVSQMLNEQPLDADAWFLKLTIDKSSSEQMFAQTVDLARTAFIRRWNQVHQEVLTGKPATEPAASQPATGEGAEQTTEKVEPLDPAPLIAKVKGEPADSVQRAAVISVISDNAWFEVYYARKADAAARWIELLRQLQPADSPILQRLEGWHALVAGQAAQARDILAKVQADDPLSALGVITADQQLNRPIDPATIRKLLDENRVGLVAAILWTTFKNDANRPTSRPSAQFVDAQINKLSASYLLVLDPRQASRVYSVMAEPVQSTFGFGTAVLARVTIENISDIDLTIGSDALIRPDLWIDAQTIGLGQQTFPHVAYDQLQGAIILRPHTRVSQLVRLDEGALRKALYDAPGSQETTVNAQLVLNPIPMVDPATKQEMAYPGAGGMVANFFRTFTYAGVPLTLPSGQRAVQETLNGTSVVDKIHLADLLAAYLRMAAAPKADPDVKKAAAGLPDNLTKLRQDKSPLVSGWADYVAAGLAQEADAQKIASDMAASPQWTTRLLSLFAGESNVPAAARRQIAAKLANDPDPAVKAAAAATVELIDQTPASQPAAK